VRGLAGVEAADDLFGLAPEEFVAARDDLARRLKRGGDAEEAARVKALRRPPLSAWAVNQLARGRGPELEALLAAGERLRSAHRAAVAGGGAAELRKATRAEREAVTGLVAAALELLERAGHPATDATRDRIAATLHAAAADPTVAELVRHGRLTSDLDPAGFGTTPEPGEEEEEPEPAPTPRARAAATGAGRAGGRTARAEREAEAPTAGRAGREAEARPGQAGRARRAVEDPAEARARRRAAVAARDEARKKARRAADQAVLATRHAERLGRLADQAEREAARARKTAAAAIEAASAARERAATAAKELREAEAAIPSDR
jgi:hypothetical protein